MSSPRRMIDADDDFERELIRSAHDDRPRQQALERMLVGLGVGLTGVASAAPAAGSQLGVMVLVKWLMSGMALGLATAGGAHVAGRALEPQPLADESPAPDTGRKAPLAGAEHAVPSRVEAPQLAADVPREPHTERSPSRMAAPHEARAVAAAGASARPSAGSALGSFPLERERAAPVSLADETRLLEAARRALTAGDASLALANLETYERTCPNGALQPEASVLQVRALLAAGNRAGAEALGRRIIQRAPASEHADAVRAALGPGTNP